MALLEAEFAARGLQWAPHKKRGPCRCIEFLGLLLCNVEGLRGITISRKRRASLMADIEAWLALEPHEGDLSAKPTTSSTGDPGSEAECISGALVSA